MHRAFPQSSQLYAGSIRLVTLFIGHTGCKQEGQSGRFPLQDGRTESQTDTERPKEL